MFYTQSPMVSTFRGFSTFDGYLRFSLYQVMTT
eukprot:UN12466